MPVLIPSSHVTALVNGGRLNVIGSPVRRTELPLVSILLVSRVPHVSRSLRDVGILPLRNGHHRQTPMPRPVHRPHREDHIILRKLHRDASHGAHILDVLPLPARRRPPQHFIFRRQPAGRSLPGQRGVILQILSQQMHIRRRRRCRRQRCQRSPRSAAPRAPHIRNPQISASRHIRCRFPSARSGADDESPRETP